MPIYSECSPSRSFVRLFVPTVVGVAMLASQYGVFINKDIYAASQTISALTTASQRKVLNETFVRNLIGIAQMSERRLGELAKEYQKKSVKDVSCATGCEFSYVSKGASGLYSGDFFDLVMLDEERLLVRFGDVMGHDRFAASIALALVAGFHSKDALNIVQNLYLTEDNGQLQALYALGNALRVKRAIFYTLTDSIINLRSRRMSSVFLGSEHFMLVRKTKQQDNKQEQHSKTNQPTDERFEVDKIDRQASRLPFVFMSDDFTVSADSYFEIKPHAASYESGDYLVYISDGLTGRMVGEEMLSTSPVAQRLIAEAFKDTQSFADVATTIYEKLMAATSSQELDDITVLVIKLP